MPFKNLSYTQKIKTLSLKLYIGKYILIERLIQKSKTNMSNNKTREVNRTCPSTQFRK